MQKKKEMKLERCEMNRNIINTKGRLCAVLY